MMLISAFGFRATPSTDRSTSWLLLLSLFLTILTLSLGQQQQQQQQEYGMHEEATTAAASSSMGEEKPSTNSIYELSPASDTSSDIHSKSYPSSDGETSASVLSKGTNQVLEEQQTQQLDSSDRSIDSHITEQQQQQQQQQQAVQTDKQQHHEEQQSTEQTNPRQQHRQQQEYPFKETANAAFGMPLNGTAAETASSLSSSSSSSISESEQHASIPDTSTPPAATEESTAVPFFITSTMTTGTTRFTMEELERLLVRLSNNDDDDDDMEYYFNGIPTYQQQQEPFQYRMAEEEEEEEVYLDDRTLLDIFGEVAKEFLTQKVIPQTNETCRWDWRSLQCEPACECEFQPRWGDYHLGRSCRLREESSPNVAAAAAAAAAAEQQQFCPYMDPTSLAQEFSWPQRVWWLMRRTAKGVRRRSQRLVQGVVVKSAARLSELQTNVCSELWDLLYHHKEHQTCWPPRQVPIATIPERILCGPIEFPVCGKDNNPASSTSYRQETRMSGTPQSVYTGNAS